MFTCVTVANARSLAECSRRTFRKARAGYLLIAGGIVTVVAVLGIDASWGTGMANTVVMSLLSAAGIGLACYICYAHCKRSFARHVARGVAQVKAAYGSDSVELPVRFAHDRVEVARSDGAVATLSLNDLAGWHETEHYIALSFGDDMLLPLDKTRIEGGTFAEFVSYIDAYVR